MASLPLVTLCDPGGGHRASQLLPERVISPVPRWPECIWLVLPGTVAAQHLPGHLRTRSFGGAADRATDRPDCACGSIVAYFAGARSHADLRPVFEHVYGLGGLTRANRVVGPGGALRFRMATRQPIG